MPQYYITGLDNETGERRTAIIRAGTEQKAVDQCGFVVASAAKLPGHKKSVALLGAALCVLTAVAYLLLAADHEPTHKTADNEYQPDLSESSPLTQSSAPSGGTDPEVNYYEPTWWDENASAIAYVMMQEFVLRRLRSPSTASFPLDEYTSRARRIAGQRYYVSGSVDSSNGFGAIVRSEYAGVLERISEDEWRLIDLTIEGR